MPHISSSHWNGLLDGYIYSKLFLTPKGGLILNIFCIIFFMYSNFTFSRLELCGENVSFVNLNFGSEVYAPVQDEIPEELRKIETADPVRELRMAMDKGNMAFLSVGGFGLFVPGVDGQRSNPLVNILGTREIKGTGDVLSSPDYLRLQRIAYQYAERYNHLLLKNLVKNVHPSVLRARNDADQEMKRLEDSDPISDAKKMLQHQKQFPTVIEVFGQADRTPGVTDTKLFTMGNARGYSPLRLSREFLTNTQNKRLSNIIHIYVVPYNRYVYHHYKQYQD